MAWPLSEKPALGSKAKYLMPNSVVVLSTTAPPTERSVSRLYRLGEPVDQSAGLVTFMVMVALCVCPAATLTVEEPRATVFPAGFRMAVATCTDVAAQPSLATSLVTCAPADPA